jgi:truncated hemoglobin YjbI
MDGEAQSISGGRVTDYDRVGGRPVVIAVIERFHERVLGDPFVADQIDRFELPELKRHHINVVTRALGGRSSKTEPRIDQLKSLATDISDGRILDHLAAALIESGVPDFITSRVLRTLL